jgi:hypothetical protein
MLVVLGVMGLMEHEGDEGREELDTLVDRWRWVDFQPAMRVI